MTNKEILIKQLELIGATLGTYDSKLDKLTQKGMKEVASNILDYDSTDVPVKVRGAWFVVEVIGDNGNELDFHLTTKEQYLNEYGDEYEYKFQ